MAESFTVEPLASTSTSLPVKPQRHLVSQLLDIATFLSSDSFRMTNVDDTASMEDANMGEASQPLSTVGEGPSTAGDRSSSMKQQQSIGQDGYENAQEEEEEDDDDGEEEEERENNDDEHHPRHNHHDYDDEDKSMGAENQPPNGKRGHKSYK